METSIPLISANMTWLENSFVHKLTASEMIKFDCNWQLFFSQASWIPHIQNLIQRWKSCAPDANRVCAGTKSLNWGVLYFSGMHILTCEKEKIRDLQIHSQIGEMIKIHINKNSTLVILWCLHVWWRRNWFIYSWIVKHLIKYLH